MKRTGWDNQMRDLKTTWIDQIHVLSGDGWRGWDGMIRWKILKTIENVHVLAGDRWRGWDGMIRWDIFKRLTYILEAVKRMGWDNQMRHLKINWPSSRTTWRQMKRMGWDDQMRDLKNNWPCSHTGWRQMKRMDGMIRWEILKTIEHVHVLAGDRWRGWDGISDERS